MEIYIPYIVGSTVTAYLGKVAYSYFSYEKESDNSSSKLNLDIDKNDYELINNKGERQKFWKPLGFGMKEKMYSIKKICSDECGFEIKYSNKRKERSKLLFYISNYERLGHYDFVDKYVKKWKLNQRK